MKKNNCTAIICEYNPFHNGHKYQISEAKKFSETVLCIMSGNTVQRGGFSCADKYERAKIAVENGADIVVEHPFPHCMSSAADFSDSGVYIANSLKADCLAFGHESDEKILLEIAKILSENDFSRWIKKTYKNDTLTKNLSYPKLREIYLENMLGKEKASVMKLPNNILSIEYLLSLKNYSTITPKFIERNFSHISAGCIRNKIEKGESVLENVPHLPNRFFPSQKTDLCILTHLNLETEYKDIYDCDESLYNRIISHAKSSLSLDELIQNCTTSAYTSSKVRRAIYSIFFSTSKESVKSKPSFTVLLAASENGIKYLSENKKQFEIPILTRATDEGKYNLNTENSFIADRIYRMIEGEKYTPYLKPYIQKTNINPKGDEK